MKAVKRQQSVDRQRRKNSTVVQVPSKVSACSYGVHPFEYQDVGKPDLHMHYCPECKALYFAQGENPCYQCAVPSATVDA